jgi:hypothetical protein
MFEGINSVAPKVRPTSHLFFYKMDNFVGMKNLLPIPCLVTRSQLLEGFKCESKLETMEG